MAYMMEKNNALCGFFWGEGREGKRPFGRPMHKWENMKTYLKGID
jgi:hypothetical protein